MSITARIGARRLTRAAADGTLADLCRRENVALMVMFGSGAADGSTPGDVDIAVAFGADQNSGILSLLDALYWLTGYEGFDVLDLSRAGPVAKERALVGAKVLYEAAPGLFANRQIAAMMERMETAPFRRLDLELMAE